MDMNLNGEQRELIQRAKDRGEHRTEISFTPEQRHAWRIAAEQELQAKDENLAHFQRLKVAAGQPGLLGDIRRAIVSSRRPSSEIAQAAGIDDALLSEFRAGEAELSTPALGRLVEALGLRLMQEIPRSV
jgi:hypothetical protein